MYKLSTIFEEYKKKLRTADEAVKIVKSGDRIHYGLFNGLVVDLDKALAKRTQELHDVLVMNTIWAYPFPPQILVEDPNAEHFKYLSTHFSGFDRQWNRKGNCWYVPVQFRENPKLWYENVGPINVAMLQVAPMDKWGNFNIGPQVAEYWGIIERADVVIVEVNKNQPIAHGMRNTINVSEVDMIVEGSNVAMPIIKGKEGFTDVEQKIGGFVSEKIKDGSTLQLGIGGIPNYVGGSLAHSDIHDLSVHSEMFVDAYLKLYEAGKITGKKNLDRGKMVYTFAQGTQALYDFINDNPICATAPVDYVNDIHVIGSNDNVVSINSCLQVDLFGQINSESDTWRHVGGNGGQLDFVMGAFKSNGGQSFLCTPSTRTDKEGNLIPLVIPRLPEGSLVTVPRAATHYVVTEYGIVNLKGKSTWERAELIISIAHPKFQDEMVKEAEKMGLWKTSSKVTY